ncbi:MAG: SIR2 family protein [Promethearchaeota archaeon]
MSKAVPYDIKGATVEELAAALKDPVIIFAGAGVSIPAPTCAPSWWTLTQDILENFFARAPDAEDLGELRFRIDRQPEEVFENFANILDYRLFTVFKVLDEGKPNGNHITIARLMKQGKVHAVITTNFDRYFERVLEAENVVYRLVVTNREYNQYLADGCPGPALLKIHGTTDRPDTIVSIASQYKTSKGFNWNKAEVFLELMTKYECVFMGYSGWDFLHSNYKRFWEKTSPKCKGIIWNVRPGETEGPPLREIIPTDRLRFTNGELPAALIEVGKNIKLNVDDLKTFTREEIDQEWNNASKQRGDWMKYWVEQIPMAFIIGLALTDLSTYSTAYQNWLKKGHQKTMEQAQIDAMNEAQEKAELQAKLQKGEITQEEFQAKSMEMLVDSMYYNAHPDRRSALKEVGNKVIAEKFNGAAIMALQYIQILVQFARASLSIEEIAQRTEELYERKKHLESNRTKENEFQLKIMDYEPLMVDIKGRNLKKLQDSIAVLREKFLADQISESEFQVEFKKIADEIVRINAGQVDFNLYRYLLVEELIKCPEDQFSDAIDALVLTILHQSQILMWRVKNDPRTNPVRDNEGIITEDSLKAIDDAIKEPYLRVFERARALNASDEFFAKLELALAAIWIKLTQYFGRKDLEQYSESWDNDNYFVNGIPEECFRKIKEKLDLVDSQMNKFSPQYKQLIYSHKATLAEGGNDFELAKSVVEASLKETNGIVTEATRPPIPEVLAGFYDRMGDYENAIRWYDVALEALRLAIVRKEGDMIVYRAMVCNEKLGNKKRALEIAGRYLSAYTELEIIRGAQYKKFGTDLTERLTKELGYSSVEAAFAELIPGKIY